MKILQWSGKAMTLEVSKNEFRTILHCAGEANGRCDRLPALLRVGAADAAVCALADNILNCPAAGEWRRITLSLRELELTTSSVEAAGERLDDSDLWYIVAARRGELEQILSELRSAQIQASH